MKTILIVDDEAKIRRTYAKTFIREGFVPLEASNAVEAHDIIGKQQINKAPPIDLVLLDIKMPTVNGTVLCEVTQMFHKKVKVIISSVYPVEEQKRLIEGADDYFDKAEGLKALVQKVRSTLTN